MTKDSETPPETSGEVCLWLYWPLGATSVCRETSVLSGACGVFLGEVGCNGGSFSRKQAFPSSVSAAMRLEFPSSDVARAICNYPEIFPCRPGDRCNGHGRPSGS